MAKKPMFTDDELDGHIEPEPSATRPLGAGPSPDATRAYGETAAAPASPPPTEPARPVPGVDAHGHARPATRIMGYSTPPAAAEPGNAAQRETVGWLVIVKGPGRGASVTLHSGMNGVGRDPSNGAQVDFGDEAISRDAHAYVTYDNERRAFHISHGGKTNLVRLNDEPVLTSQRLEDGDLVRIGETTMRFVALCGPGFDWSDD